MAPLPKRRHSTRRGGKRHAALFVALKGLVACPQCKTMRIPHRVCINCGFYDGKAVVVKRIKAKKKA